ncbi:MAG TPA: type II toxin-antitoxin system HicB family antitoxin [Blastocatellia bacterium]
MSNNYRYEIVIYWSEKDKSYTAQAPELPGCSAAHGASYMEALTSLEIIIAKWVDHAAQLGRPIPKPMGRLIFA